MWGGKSSFDKHGTNNQYKMSSVRWFDEWLACWVNIGFINKTLNLKFMEDNILSITSLVIFGIWFFLKLQLLKKKKKQNCKIQLFAPLIMSCLFRELYNTDEFVFEMFWHLHIF